jgi:hypothetical protein
VSLTAYAYATNKTAICCCILLAIHVAAKRRGEMQIAWELLPKVVDKGGGAMVKNKAQFWYYFREEVKNYKIQTFN